MSQHGERLKEIKDSGIAKIKKIYAPSSNNDHDQIAQRNLKYLNQRL